MNDLHQSPHRQAVSLAVSLFNGGESDYLAISRQIRAATGLHRETCRRIAAKVCRVELKRGQARQKAPDASVRLTQAEKEYIGRKGLGSSEAIHRGMRLLMEREP